MALTEGKDAGLPSLNGGGTAAALSLNSTGKYSKNK